MNIALVIAGGSGTRMGLDLPKQYYKVRGVPILIYILKTLQQAECIDEIAIVCAKEWTDRIREYTLEYGIQKPCSLLLGGATRQDTAANGIAQLAGRLKGDDIVCMLDANRPLIPQSVIENCILTARTEGAAIAVDNCSDSMYLCTPDKCVSDALDRSRLFRGQCPEAVNFELAQRVFQIARKEGLENQTLTSLLIHCGERVRAVQGSPLGFKITTMEDLALFKAYLALQNQVQD